MKNKASIQMLFHNKRGNMLPLIMVIVFVLFSFSMILAEVFRINGIQSHIEYELQRAVNIAVEYSMQDSWRQDKLNRLDAAQARSVFYDYLYTELALNGANQKIEEKLIYTLELNNVEAQIEPPRLLVSGVARVRSAFVFLIDDINIPFDIKSKNFRLE